MEGQNNEGEEGEEGCEEAREEEKEEVRSTRAPFAFGLADAAGVFGRSGLAPVEQR
jgi:hypothetical protein